MNPTIGRIVHYVLPGPHGCNVGAIGEHRPAMVVRVVDSTTVRLRVFTDGELEGIGDFLATASLDPDGTEHGSWHWPEIERTPAELAELTASNQDEKQEARFDTSERDA